MLTTPLFVLEQTGEISIYANEADLVSDLEPIDVENGEYEAFDSLANVIELKVQNQTVQNFPWFLGGVTRRDMVLLEETQRSIGEDRLKSILNNALDLLQHPLDQRPKVATALVELATEIFGFSPKGFSCKIFGQRPRRS